MTTTIRTMFLALALATVTVLGVPTSAQAANGCGGVYQGSRTVTERAVLDVYLENGTTNCIALRTVGAYYGKASWMGVGIGGPNSINACNYPQTINEGRVVCGNYHYWVGGAKIYAPHTCITLWASLVVNGVQYTSTFPNQFCE